MSTGEDEPSSGLNGRLRPRKSNIPSPQSAKITRKPDAKLAHDKSKRTSTPSKVSPNKPDDLTDKADSPAPQILCPYCDKIFSAKQAVSKHIRAHHLLTPKQEHPIKCLFCNYVEDDRNDIIRHMVDNHPNQYFACYDCHTRFLSTTELAEHKLNVCEKQKLPYRNKLRQKTTPKKSKKTQSINGQNEYRNDDKNFPSSPGFNGTVVISCELKPSHPNDPTDIEDNITTNLILPQSKSNTTLIEKNAVIVLDDLQWNKRIPPNFSFHNTDADQILSRLGVVHRSPRAGESNRREWLKNIDESTQKFEKCFDTSFYSKVASNVQENLTKFLDGSFNFNPDAENTIKTRKAKNSVAINTVEGFPILLASNQFNRNIYDAYMPRAIAPKHKWKWDNLESEKALMCPEQIKRDSHTNNCIISLVSSLDIWTQLCMRRKFEQKFNKSPVEKKNEKQNIIARELKEILESRELPATSSQVVRYRDTPIQVPNSSDFPASLGLVPAKPNYDLKPAVLSGEWVRPRCYVCCACGAQTHDSRALASHISNHHPNAQIQHYEIVGEVLLNSDILKHLYVPPSQMNNRTRPLRGFRECTKCKQSITLDDLHQHMLDCAGDTPTVRRKCKYRPFGMRKRRPRLPDNTIRKKIRKDIRSRHSRKNHIRPRPKIRTEVGDAETIRKMLADLPAKRHRVMVNPLNPILRPRKKVNKQRNTLVMKKRMIDEVKKQAPISGSSQGSGLSSDESKKVPMNHIDTKPIKKTVKRVASKLLRHKDSLAKNATMRRSRRKGVPTKEPRANADNSDAPLQPTEGGGDRQNERSIENNSERTNANDGSHNRRERSNSNDRSNNRNNPSGGSGDNNNSENASAPAQNVPLKHSIARLTANSETHDKAVQFHKLFLIRQKCNDTTQHLPSEERMLFENEAIVTKLDKPPLHFNPQAVMDSHFYQKNKFNKRNLNDCIAMLKNKLVEPNLGPPPGHVSVQCGTDEPLDPEPPIIERRYSTTDANIESIHRSMLVNYREKSLDTQQSFDTESRVTRRSYSARRQSRKEKTPDVQANNDYLQWKLYYESQMYSALKNSEQYTRRESRGRPCVSAEELMMQHALNLELLTGQHLTNFADYNYTKPVPPQKSARKSRDGRSKSRLQTAMDTNTHEINAISKTNPPIRPRRNSRRKTDLSPAQILNGRASEKQSVLSTANNLLTTENVMVSYPQRAVSEDRTNPVMETPMLAQNNFPDEQSYRPTLLYQNAPIMQYTNESDVRPIHYSIPSIEPIVPVPLDLSNRSATTGEQEQCRRRCCALPYGQIETLDSISKRYYNQIPIQKESQVNRDDIVNLRQFVNYASHLNDSSSLTPLPSEVSMTVMDNNVAGLSLEHTDIISNRDPYYPTDLSVRRTSTEIHSYDKRIHGSEDEITMVQNLSHPIMHSDHLCARDDYEVEIPTDLSRQRHKTNSNISVMSEEQRVNLNICSNNQQLNNDHIPDNLSPRSKDTEEHHIYMDSQAIPDYYEPIVVNNETGSIHNISQPQLATDCMDTEQIVNVHYNSPTILSTQANNTRSSTIITYSDSELHRPFIARNDTPKISTTNLSFCDIASTMDTKSLCNNDPCNKIAYSQADMPLSISMNTVSDSHSCNSIQRETVDNSKMYEHNQKPFELPNDPPIQQIESSNILNKNITNNLSSIQKLSEDTSETAVMSQDSVSPALPNLKKDELKQLHEKEKEDSIESKKRLSRKRSPFPHVDQEVDSERRIVEAKTDTVTSVLDNDPETAKKIAMLPKELVEILGNMPVDHRNQLLNVLPQYVSTSTSPPSSSNSKSFRGDSGTLTTNITSLNHISNDSEKEYTTETKLEDGLNVSNNTASQFIDTSPTTVSSSILLTPPTPQLADRYTKSHEINETNSKDSRKSNIPLIKNMTLDENDTKDRVIDLTVDEFSTENPDTSYNPDPSIHSIPVPPLGPSIQKINSDKTASLRAVRIKTPSERHRSILAKTTPLKKLTVNNVSISDDELNNTAGIKKNPMAIQQAEISSTQHRTTRTSPISPTFDQRYKANTLVSNQQGPKEKETVIKSDHDRNYNLHDKHNVVTSSLSKDNIRIKNVDLDTRKENLPENSLEAINVSSSKKSDAGCDLSTKNHEISKKTIINQIVTSPISKDKLSIEDEDSEDDVTLAVIVQQKHRDLKCVVENEYELCSKKKREINKIKKSEQISEEKSSQDKNDLILTDNILPVAETDVTKNSTQSSEKTKDIDRSNDISNERASSKKKGRKGHKVDNLCPSKHIEQQDHLYRSISENDINKENNLSSDVVSKMEVVEDMVTTESSVSDTIRSIIPNKTIVIDIEISAKKEKLIKAIELPIDCTNASAKIQGCNQSSETINKNKKEQETYKVISRNKVNLISSNTPCYSKPTTQNNVFNKEHETNNTENVNVSEDIKITDNSQVTDIKKQSTDEVVIKPNNEMAMKNNLYSVDIESDKQEEKTQTDVNTTPLRRSRRGKSLYIDNSSVVNDNSLQIENPTEHKTPLTKKQLIFSKLQLDEENHNKSINNHAEKQTNIITPGIPLKDSYEFTSDSEIEREPSHEEKKSIKRKKTLQFKRKCKKKKLAIGVQSHEDNEVETATKSEEPNSKVSVNVNISDKPLLQQKYNYLDKDDFKIDEMNRMNDSPTETSSNKQKNVSTEKRKSCSPSRSELSPSLKPKKSKLIEEVSSKIPDNLGEEVKIVESNEGVTAIVVSRNTPCYNKPAVRRARSKSVVVKSSGAELYDPYDINLEDMVEKTEPFIRKEISTKVGLNSYKSSIAAKTRKLSKTAPSAIIDISPSDCTDVILQMPDKNVTFDQTTIINRTKDNSSDSDESSKSDVPLKKYVEEKERKLLEESNKFIRHEESKDNGNNEEKNEKTCDKTKPRRKSMRAQSINNKNEKTQNKKDTDEELRSEQFMESFGFFSERKPRKSNLLATKKISETFHIIANESDDVYFGSKDRVSKKGSNENKREEVKNYSKKPTKRGRKKKNEPPPGPSYCDVCKRAFRRSDNYLRHQMSLIHISKVSEVELKVKTIPIEEEPNYLIAYKQQLDRLKVLQNKIAKRKKNCISTADIILPTLEEILADVKRTIREQQLSRRGLSRDQELFIDCCEMLKESHKNDQVTVNKRIRNCNSFNCAVTCQEELALLERSISDDRCDIKCDGDVDSITAKNILESEEVRNLENDLIFNLKEANKLKGSMNSVQIETPEEFSSINEQEVSYDDKSYKTKSKRSIEVKDKMYPDVVENIDIFEDKFDKIKRKCRSQAAAAKNMQTHVETNPSLKNRKKSEKKKGKKNFKKCQGRTEGCTVPTKGALKGFDGIKVSIQTSDINLSAIVPSVGNSFKKKKKNSSKKKRERKNSNESSKYDSDPYSKETTQKKVDVYEFMDSEDTELFEFRPSTLMERFKSISNKEIPSTSKITNQNDLAEISSESASDGDDFVYMSDDYVCSDDETENSMLSCELGSGSKKTASPLKRKDVIEKNAVMGKIFKHAVRSERKSPKRRETPKPKANLDQLFDSLLQEELKPSSPAKDEPVSLKPTSSRVHSSLSPKLDLVQSTKYNNFTSKRYDEMMPLSSDNAEHTTSDLTNYPSTSSKKRKSITPPRKLNLNLIPNNIEYELLAPIKKDNLRKFDINKERRHSSHHFDIFSKKSNIQPEELKKSNIQPEITQSEEEDSSVDEYDGRIHRIDNKTAKHKSEEHAYMEKLYLKKKEEKPKSVDYSEPFDQTFEDAGVARQRARRKCAVGKQNVLAETWSSESEPDGAPPRPNSAESVIGGTRKKKGKKKDMLFSRKANRPVKKPETERLTRPRAPCYWSEGDDEQEHPQQHGWIVGDSHKKLVTMLAHAKGRKRHDDKRAVLE